MIPIQMELGGKDACIVCHDADIDLAAKNIVKVCELCWPGTHMLTHLFCCPVFFKPVSHERLCSWRAVLMLRYD